MPYFVIFKEGISFGLWAGTTNGTNIQHTLSKFHESAPFQRQLDIGKVAKNKID